LRKTRIAAVEGNRVIVEALGDWRPRPGRGKPRPHGA